APHREGGQAQYVERPLPPRSSDDPMSQVLDWAIEHLDEPLTVDDLARRARMSRRTFVRAFRDRTGTTRASWVTSKHLDDDRRLRPRSPATPAPGGRIVTCLPRASPRPSATPPRSPSGRTSRGPWPRPRRRIADASAPPDAGRERPEATRLQRQDQVPEDVVVRSLRLRRRGFPRRPV